jgi:hypothetical protein
MENKLVNLYISKLMKYLKQPCFAGKQKYRYPRETLNHVGGFIMVPWYGNCKGYCF